ncbi:hypothetical protein HGA64_03185 [Candidatus Falkowbacteria bacterium]|nr:hypothetical protein [Candidatus Falkowbacteria bacterium]
MIQRILIILAAIFFTGNTFAASPPLQEATSGKDLIQLINSRPVRGLGNQYSLELAVPLDSREVHIEFAGSDGQLSAIPIIRPGVALLSFVRYNGEVTFRYSSDGSPSGQVDPRRSFYHDHGWITVGLFDGQIFRRGVIKEPVYGQTAQDPGRVVGFTLKNGWLTILVNLKRLDPGAITFFIKRSDNFLAEEKFDMIDSWGWAQLTTRIVQPTDITFYFGGKNSDGEDVWANIKRSKFYFAPENNLHITARNGMITP